MKCAEPFVEMHKSVAVDHFEVFVMKIMNVGMCILAQPSGFITSVSGKTQCHQASADSTHMRSQGKK